jgi:hypothetical protein
MVDLGNKRVDGQVQAAEEEQGQVSHPVRISWIDSSGQPSHIHLTEDGVRTLCDAGSDDHAHYISSRKLAKSPNRIGGRSHYCRTCFVGSGKKHSKSLPWDVRCTTISETRRKVITLWEADQPILIVPAKTGIFYSNQTGGCACNHPVAEGYLYPLPRVNPMDHQCFNSCVWYRLGGCAAGWPVPAEWTPTGSAALAGLDKRTALEEMQREAVLWWDDFIEEIEGMPDRVRGWPKMRFVRADKSEEAWVNVEARLDFEVMDGAKKSKRDAWIRAILTWPNYD